MSKEAGADADMGGRAKVAIPRQSGFAPISQRKDNKRVTHACEPCRQRKTKCDGSRPVCGHCRRLLIQCEYTDGKREKAKMLKLQQLEERVEVYERLLHSVLPKVDLETQVEINRAIQVDYESHPSINEPTEAGFQSLSARPAEDLEEGPRPDTEIDGSDDDSIGSFGHLTEDINTLSINKPAGFMGRGSETAWLKLLQTKLNMAENPGDKNYSFFAGSTEGTGTAPRDISATYHMDDIDLSLVTQYGEKQLDPYVLPPKELGDSLIQAYFITLHPLVPLLSRREFMHHYNAVYNTQEGFRVSNKRLSVINLVFAIGQRYFESFGNVIEWQHLTFFMRARILGALDGGLLFEVPTLFDVQALGLTGLYLLCSKHTNRSWNTVGLTLRLAYGQGLHIRNADVKLDNYQREMRVRVWYSIVYLEATLCLVTGRPTGLQDHDFSGPVPQLSTVGGGPDIFYLELMRISMLAAAVQEQLYNGRASKIRRRRAVAERTIANLAHKVDNWKGQLPDVLDFDHDITDKNLVRQRIDLAFRYHNVVILVCFPYLMWSTSTATDDSFARRGARRCVDAARIIIDIIMKFCDSDNTETSARELPWWCLLHYIVCAEAVLMLEIVHQVDSAGCLDVSSEALLDEARRPLEWLSRVSATDLAAKRTFLQLTRLLKIVASAAGQYDDPAWPGRSNDEMFVDPIWLTPDMGIGIDPGGVEVYDQDMASVPAAGYDHFSAPEMMVANPWDGEERRMSATEGPGGDA